MTKRRSHMRHHMHRKGAITKVINKGSRIYRLYWKLNQKFVELGFTHEHKPKSERRNNLH